MPIDLTEKSVQELNNLIDNHRRRQLLKAPLFLEALAEREHRRKNGLEFRKSLAIIQLAARDQKCVSYKQLADASGAEWNKVHYAMNRHLWDLVSSADGHGWPMLSAVVVNQENIESKQMKEGTLKGFVAAAENLGRTDIGDDHVAFLSAEQRRVFAWAKEQPHL